MVSGHHDRVRDVSHNSIDKLEKLAGRCSWRKDDTSEWKVEGRWLPRPNMQSHEIEVDIHFHLLDTTDTTNFEIFQLCM